MRHTLNRLFNWKRHPSSVFFLAAPLAAIGFGLIFDRAVLELLHNNDPWYLVIAVVGMALLALALWPIRRRLKGALNG